MGGHVAVRRFLACEASLHIPTGVNIPGLLLTCKQVLVV